MVKDNNLQEVWIYDFPFYKTHHKRIWVVFFLTHTANNLESESQARFFIPAHVVTSISSFSLQAQIPPYLHSMLESSKHSDMSAILELPTNLNNPNSPELQSSSCNMLPAYGLYDWKLEEEDLSISVWNIFIYPT